MDNITKQDRITLKNLKVADFASEETLCFNATVVFDGTPIAEARNDGHGGSTFLHALKSRRDPSRPPSPSFPAALDPSFALIRAGSEWLRSTRCP